MTFLDFLDKEIFTECEWVYVDENKHKKCFKNAYNSFEPFEEIRAIVDASLFNSGKVGIIFTDKAIYTKDPFRQVFRDDVIEIESLDYTYQPDNQRFELMINGNFAKSVILSKFEFECVEHLISSYLEYLKVLADEREKIEKEEKAKQEKIRLEKAEREKAVREQAERERAEREKAELEKRTVSTEDGRYKVTRESVLKTYESDAIYQHIYRTRETLTSTLFSHWGRSSSDRDKLAMSVKDYFSYNIIAIRENSIDKYNIYQLKNDLATFEINLFLAKVLCGELKERGLNREQIFFVLLEGLSILFPSTKETEMYIQVCATIVDEYLANFGKHRIALDDMLYMNLLYTNITENPSGIPIYDGVIDFYPMTTVLYENSAGALTEIMRYNIDKFKFKYNQEVRERSVIEFNNIARKLLGINLVDNHRIRMMKKDIDDIINALRVVRLDLR